MTDLSPEEKQKIYAEEKARVEAQDKIKAEAKDKTTKEKKRQSIGCGIGCLTLVIIFVLILIFGTEDKTPTTKLPVTKSQRDPGWWVKIHVERFKNPMKGDLEHIQLEVIHKSIVTIELIKDEGIRKPFYDYAIELLKDEDADIRATVASALRQTTGQDFGEDYDKWLEWWKANEKKQKQDFGGNYDKWLEWWKAKAQKKRIAELIKQLKDEERNVRLDAVKALKALGEIGDKSAVKPLIAVLKDKDGLVLLYAIAALGEIGDKSAVKPLIAAMKDEDGSFRQEAGEALRKLTNQDFGEDYEKWQEWWEANKKKPGE